MQRTFAIENNCQKPKHKEMLSESDRYPYEREGVVLNFSEMVRQVGQRHSDSKTCCKVKGEGHLEGGFVNLGKEGGEKKQWKEHWGISAMCAKGTLGRDVVN